MNEIKRFRARLLLSRLGVGLLGCLCSALSVAAQEAKPGVRISTLAENGMPRDIVPRRSDWNFGPGSLWTHKGWQYAAYWDEKRQVSVARRKLPAGDWAVVSLPGYQRTETGDRGKGGRISQGFGDGHEKVAMGISPDGIIHLSFDHHLSTLRYQTSKLPVADDPDAHPWSAELFGPVRDHLGGPRLTSVTYPSFHTDGTHFLLYMRLGGGSGSGNSHLFTWEDGSWSVNTEKESQIIDKNWSGGNGTVNAYPFGLTITKGRCHLTWCWRDTPNERTCHDLCYAYSDDLGGTWQNNDGELVGKRGVKFITPDSSGIAVWRIPPGTRYRNGGSMTLDAAGGVHVLIRNEEGRPVHVSRDPATGDWSRYRAPTLGRFLAPGREEQMVFADGTLYRLGSGTPAEWREVHSVPEEIFEHCKAGSDPRRFQHDGWISVIGQEGRKVRVVDFPVEPRR